MKSVQGKYVCVIATSADHSDTEEMKKALKRVGANRYFHLFYCQKDLGYKKPDPRFFEAVIWNADYKPDECVMIGNMYEKDIVGAKAIGIKTIFFNENQLAGQFPQADAIVNHMNEINIELINKL